jgi:predicted GNAT superfamily acetyltransferase
MAQSNYPITQLLDYPIPMPYTFRPLSSFADFREVVALERRIWGPGYDDVVPAPILSVTVKRGGILVGAFARDRMVGFVYSIPGLKNGRPTQWSHMLGVVDEYRGAGLGSRLKLLQREQTLALGLDLIEWTYDPLQAANAHLNFVKLGVVVEEYEENAYGESASPLHRGNPTDRFIAEWWIRKPHVERRIASARPFALKSDEIAAAPPANRARPAGEWLECANVDLSLDDRRVTVEIPVGFTEMLANNAELALAWRLQTREIFTTYFARGYRAVDFSLDRAAHLGAYLLTR